MDAHVRWLRRRILFASRRSIGPLLAGGSVLGFLGLWLVTGGGLVSLVPWSLLIGQLVTVLAVVRAALTNPLSVGYLRRFAAQPRHMRLIDAVGVDPEVLDLFGHHGLFPYATLVDELAAGEPLFDLFQTPKQTVTVSRSRRSGSVSLMSRLSDGRILLTDTVLTVPHSQLVLNLAPGRELNPLIVSHRRAVAQLHQRGLRIRPDDGRLFSEALTIEWAATAALGPLFGPFLNPTAGRAPLRFMVTLEPDELLKLAANGVGPPRLIPVVSGVAGQA